MLIVEFPVNENSLDLSIHIIDDDINEASEQTFIILLEAINATNLDSLRIKDSRKTAIGRIMDDEDGKYNNLTLVSADISPYVCTEIRIGFERQSYEITEPDLNEENFRKYLKSCVFSQGK